jgi:hypothetical protein
MFVFMYGVMIEVNATAKVQVLRFAQDDGVGRLCLMERQQQKSRSFASLRMTVLCGCVW